MVMPSRPSQPARSRSSADSSSAVSGGAPGSAYAALTSSRPPARSAFRSTRADDPVAEQERQHVVAVLPLVGGDVDLDPVVEAEEGLGAGPLPHDRVERAEQRSRVDPARQSRVAMQVRRPVPALDGRPAAARPPPRAGRSRARPSWRRSGSSRRGTARCRLRARSRTGEPARAARPRRSGRCRQHLGGQHPLGRGRRRPRTGCCAWRWRSAPTCRGSRASCATPTSSSPTACARAAIADLEIACGHLAAPTTSANTSASNTGSSSALIHLPRSSR